MPRLAFKLVRQLDQTFQHKVISVLFSRPWRRRYLLAEECYMHGLITGEAVEMLERPDLAEEVINLVLCISKPFFLSARAGL